MAGFNGFPATYQPMYYAPQYQVPQYQQAQQQPQVSRSRIYVQGEAGMKAYLVAPNASVDLWDTEAQTLYIKSADANGIPSVVILDYTVRNQAPANAPVAAPAAPATNPPAYATKADVEALAGQINAIRAEVEGMTKKEGKSDE